MIVKLAQPRIYGTKTEKGDQIMIACVAAQGGRGGGGGQAKIMKSFIQTNLPPI